MGYFSTCNVESAISTCDPYNWPDLKTKPINKPIKIREYSYNELVAATNGFSVNSFLGKGSQGSVYKAVLDNGKLIAAVKKTSQSINSGTTIQTPAENEIEILSRVQNPRLVNLIGFCNSETTSKLIVVEYMPNGSLYDLLHSNSNDNNNKPPGWTRRVRFALQIAKAVHSLHSANPPVIHRDIKSSNVLIDAHRKARLGDFGLSLRGHVEDVRIKCTPPAGTLGYLDPGYIAPGDVSTKSDVFSFGILLLEIISGRHAIDLNYSPPSIVDWAVPMIKRSEFAGICDRRLRSPADSSIVCKLGLLAARCVRTRAEKRPEMADVVECLNRVNKKMQSSAPLIWNSCKQHVTCVEQSQPSVAYTSLDGSDDGVKGGYKRIGSRRNNRKVSSVSNTGCHVDGDGAVDYYSLMGTDNNRVVRSRSVGSCSEMVYYRRKVKNRITAVNVSLSKSRSMGVFPCPKRDNLSECVLLEKKSDISLRLRNILNHD